MNAARDKKSYEIAALIETKLKDVYETIRQHFNQVAVIALLSYNEAAFKAIARKMIKQAFCSKLELSKINYIVYESSLLDFLAVKALTYPGEAGSNARAIDRQLTESVWSNIDLKYAVGDTLILYGLHGGHPWDPKAKCSQQGTCVQVVFSNSAQRNSDMIRDEL